MKRIALSCVSLLALCFAACSSSPTTPTEITLLDTTLTLAQGVTCQTGGVSTDFSGTAGKTVAIIGTGNITQTPRFTLYAPDFTRQLGGSSSVSPGSATLTIGLTETGVHHLTFCDVNGVGGTLHVTVHQQP